MIGRRIGRYRVLAPLGKGGMSTVWRAHDELLRRDIALKVLADELGLLTDSRTRFRHEALVAARLDHPGVAAVYDSGEADGLTYIAMALIEGETVSERIERALFPTDEAVAIVSRVADALSYAHARGVVHRDVTSRNIMLARDGRVLVLDFGLAIAAGVSRVSSSSTTVGTLAYMSPEVLQGREADARSDLYGLGVVLYEMLTGGLPFSGERREVLTFAALHQRIPPPSERRADVPPELDRIVLRLLAREPAERYPDAESLSADLRLVAPPLAATTDNATPAADGGAASPSPVARSVAAELLRDGSKPLYLVLVPFAVHLGEGADPDAASLAGELDEALSAMLTRLGRVHVVHAAGGPRAGETSGSYAARVGAHAALVATLRVAGSMARVTWSLVDADRGAQIAGGMVRSAVVDQAHLEDQLIADVRRGLGLQELGEERPSQARTRVPAAEERFAQAVRYLARCDNEASVDGALRILELLSAASPSDGLLHAWLARACLAKHVHTRQHTWEGRAATHLERALLLAPDAPETQLALGEMRLAGGPHEQALEIFECVLKKHPDLFDAHIGRAAALLTLGREDEAEQASRAAIALQPEAWRGHHMLGKVLLARGEPARAIEPWRRALQLCTDNVWASVNLGNALFRAGRVADAVRAFRWSVGIQPTSLGLSNLGTALFFEARYGEAAEAFERAVALTPSDPLMWGNLGNARRLSPGLGAKAPEALERAVGLMRESLQRSPEDAEGWARMSGWLAGLGRADEARVAASRALALAPHAPAVINEAAHAAYQIGDVDEALSRFAQAVRHGFEVDLLRRSPDLSGLREDARFRAILESGAGPRETGGEAKPAIGG